MFVALSITDREFLLLGMIIIEMKGKRAG
jgi:hypothetical protein